MKRVFILILDSFGVGASPDADKFGDVGANTFRHIAENYPGFSLPNLTRLGLDALAAECNGKPVFGSDVTPEGAYGCAAEISFGKDTPSGHWEITGVPVLFDWDYYPPTHPSFPSELIAKFVEKTGVAGILGDKHASGTDILKERGDEHVKTGKPIVYTSAGSVFQIAAHEESFGLERLYEICEIARELVGDGIGRVIARPFVGSNGDYKRTGNRRDYSVLPPAPTLLDKLTASGGEVIGVGKIPDIFAHQGISRGVKGDGNAALFDATLKVATVAGDRSLVFANFVDFDMQYGHRRDVKGYAEALIYFDQRLPEFEKLLQPGDMVVITADHGCDPTFKGTDHTREYIPLMVFGPEIKPVALGKRSTFADIGQTLAAYLDLPPFEYGTSFLDDITG
ncbi:MAG: phosphopentomutase [Gammaproteobacteria bacterium]|nr:phosphopentomutase [Gammaproteobacteria bacterium]